MDNKKDLIQVLKKLPVSVLKDMVLEAKRRNLYKSDSFQFIVNSDDVKPNTYLLLSQEAKDRWNEIYKKIPKSIQRPNVGLKEHIKATKALWKKSVIGYDEIYHKILPHIISYHSTLETRPICFIGPPGTGKTHIAKVYLQMLGIKPYLVNCPQNSGNGNSLYGDSQSYKEAKYGILLDAAMTTSTANPGIIFNEIDKVRTGPDYINMQDDLLSATDDCNIELKDNYFDITFNASHYVYVFTANSEHSISQPLKDRCDIIYFEEADCEMISDIITKITIPSVIKKFNAADVIVVDSDEIDKYIYEQFNKGYNSIRYFQVLMTNAVSKAYLDSIMNEAKIRISKKFLEHLSPEKESKKKNRIGFLE